MGLAFISSGFSVVVDRVEEDRVTSEVRIPPGRDVILVVVDIVVLRGRGDDGLVIVEELLVVVHDVEGIS